MAKAQITTPKGITVKIEGTPAEILTVVHDLEDQKTTSRPTKRKATKSAPVSVGNLVESLIDGGFFKKPRGLAEIRHALAEIGHHYPVTTLSGVMLNIVRAKKLKRQKTDKVWVYVR